MEKLPCYDTYLQILKEELIPAMGCTEPIAIALAAAKAREALGVMPERCTVAVSGNIIKNAKAVTVPNTGGLKGIEASVAAGVAAGRGDLNLEVLSRVTEEQIDTMRTVLDNCPMKVIPTHNGHLLYICITAEAQGHTGLCEIMDLHTNVVRVQYDDEILFQAETVQSGSSDQPKRADRAALNVRDIIAFADALDPADVAETIDRQIAYNTAVAQRGLAEDWGASVGRTLLLTGDDVATRAKAAAAGAADARMGGCSLPVVTVAGSGDQGLAASLPVIEYARDMGASREELYRALVVSSLLAVHQKTSIGRLSAFCGAVSAACGAVCGVAYLKGGRYDVISHTITNTLGICSGMACDGAKPSCAAKIAAALEAGFLGYRMYLNEQHQFFPGEGIVGRDVEKTIANVGRMAAQGMRETDKEILNIMVDN